MDFQIKRLKALCTSAKYRGSIVAVTLEITPVIGHIDVRHYDVRNDALVAELFDRSISGWNICSAEMFYERGVFRLVIHLIESVDHASNIDETAIEAVASLGTRREGA